MVDDWQTRERLRNLNSRQRRRRRAEGCVGGEAPVSCRMVTEKVQDTESFADWFGDSWGKLPLTYAVQTQTSVEVKEEGSTAKPDHRNVAAQVEDNEYPPGGISFADLARLLHQHPDLGARDLTTIAMQTLARTPITRPEERVLLGYLYASIAAEQDLVTRLQANLRQGLQTPPEAARPGFMANLELVAARLERPSSHFRLELSADPPLMELDSEEDDDDPYL